MKMWLIMLATAVVLTGCGVFFALQDLGAANDYATIASFFLALLTASASVLSLTRSKVKIRDESGSKENPHEARGATVNVAYDNDNVVQGDGNHVGYIKIVAPQPAQKGRRKA
jgi:hypothetical protein